MYINNSISNRTHRQIYTDKSKIKFCESLHVELNDRERALIAILSTSYEGKDVWFSHLTLAAKLNCSSKTIKRMLKRFKELGLISWRQRYNNSNIYTVNEALITPQNLSHARSFLKYFFAISFALLTSFIPSKTATHRDVPLEVFKGNYININHSNHRVVPGENYDLLLLEAPWLVRPPGQEFIRNRKKWKEKSMSYAKVAKDITVSGKKEMWKPDWIPLEPEQVKEVRREALEMSKSLLHDGYALTFMKIIKEGWLKEDPELATR